jgi:hypothetical protein
VPESLPEELAAAEQLGVRPIEPSDPSFRELVNEGQIKWAVTEEGQLRVIPHTVQNTEISHTVLTGGRPVLAAGEANIATGGKQTIGLEITPRSGHYNQGNDEAANAGVVELGRAAFRRFGIEFPD